MERLITYVSVSSKKETQKLSGNKQISLTQGSRIWIFLFDEFCGFEYGSTTRAPSRYLFERRLIVLLLLFFFCWRCNSERYNLLLLLLLQKATSHESCKSQLLNSQTWRSSNNIMFINPLLIVLSICVCSACLGGRFKGVN